MDPYERQRQELLANALRIQKANEQFPQVKPQAGPMSPAMMSQSSVDPEVQARANQDFTAKQKQYADQLRYGRQLLNSEGPKGKQIGNIYAAPTWSENAAGAARKALGGYNMYQANKGNREVDSQIEERDAAQGQLRATVAKQEEEQRMQDQDRWLSEQDQGQQKIDADAAQVEAENKQWAKEHNLDWEKHKANVAQDLRENELETKRMLAEKKAAGSPVSKEVAKETLNYSRDLKRAGVPALETSLKELDGTLSEFRDKDGNYKNIPGVGFLYSANNFVGDAATALDDARRPETDLPTGKMVKQDVYKVLNTVITDEAGKSQTVMEIMRQNKAAGFDMWSNDETFLEGIKAIEDILAAERKNIQQGYSKESRDLYDDRGKQIDSGEERSLEDLLRIY